MCAMLERACISVCVHACRCACTCMLVYLVVYACVNEKRVRDGDYTSKKCVSERERQTRKRKKAAQEGVISPLSVFLPPLLFLFCCNIV